MLAVLRVAAAHAFGQLPAARPLGTNLPNNKKRGAE
jgi:hypothetical protein